MKNGGSFLTEINGLEPGNTARSIFGSGNVVSLIMQISWVNNRGDASDLRRLRAHYVVIVMCIENTGNP